MTDEELLQYTVEMLGAVDERCKRLTTANFMHDVNGIRGLALNTARLIEKHLNKK